MSSSLSVSGPNDDIGISTILHHLEWLMAVADCELWPTKCAAQPIYRVRLMRIALIQSTHEITSRGPCVVQYLFHFG